MMLQTLIFLLAVNTAHADPVDHFFAIPRLPGASLGLVLTRDDSEEVEVNKARLDYLTGTDGLYLRFGFTDGPRVGQRALALLRRDPRNNEYYVYHPLIGKDAVTRPRFEKYFSDFGLPFNALVELIDPTLSSSARNWSSREDGQDVTVYGPKRLDGCRNEYRFASPQSEMPRQLRLCSGRSKHPVVVRVLSVKLVRGVTLPGRLTYSDEWGRTGEILLHPDVKQQYNDSARYRPETLSRP